MSILDQIIATKRREVAAAKRRLPMAEVSAQAAATPPPRDFVGALKPIPGRDRPRIIAELKKASPSKGLIREDFPVAELARELAAAGAAALSVLTDSDYFQGALANLRLARETVDIPLLRKDFIIDAYQIVEARAAGADAILLIAAALPEPCFRELLAQALALGLGVLAEVHTPTELAMVLQTEAPAIGVNSRDLKTFAVDLATTRRLLGDIPPERVRVAESGVDSRDSLLALADAGADAFLVGEHLMRHRHPGEALRALCGE